MIPRPHLIKRIDFLLSFNPVVALLGPRQCGKTTLARAYSQDQPREYFDLEDPADINRLSAPMMALDHLRGLIVIDEVQRMPDLFPLIRVLADRKPNPSKFLLLGSASPHLVKGVSESLAGRIAFVEMSGFDIRETGVSNFRSLWLRGGFPRSALAESEEKSVIWRKNFIQTWLERDIPQLGISIPAATLRRFWTMVAHYHGQIWNAAELARSLGSSESTMRRYLDLLNGTFVVRQLPPWHENIGKRQVKSPKVYVRDSGILHTLMSIETETALMRHPKYGASWEGFALEQVLTLPGADDAYYWATYSGSEIDLMIHKEGLRYGFEFKCADAPKITKSMRIALEDLKLTHVYIVYPGTKTYSLSDRVTVLSIQHLESLDLAAHH
jgi:hypothetical protein